jgi:hypothetical protein
MSHDLDDIPDLDSLRESLRPNSILEHDHTVRASGDNYVRFSVLDGFFQAAVTDAGVRVGFHPHLAATPSTTKSLLHLSWHFTFFKTLNLLKDLAWG